MAFRAGKLFCKIGTEQVVFREREYIKRQKQKKFKTSNRYKYCARSKKRPRDFFICKSTTGIIENGSYLSKKFIRKQCAGAYCCFFIR